MIQAIQNGVAETKCYFFYRFDVGKDKFIDLEELKRMMEKLGAPQTHLALKEMISEVDEDCDQKISFREVSFTKIWIIL